MVQRVQWGRVVVEGEVVGHCGPGLVVFVAAHVEDSETHAEKLADRVAGLRIFSDPEGKMNLPLPQTGESQVLAISNFTLYGDALKSRRPSFIGSAPYDRGKELFDHFIASLRERDVLVESGVFGAHMDVELQNDGPVTLVIDIEK